MFCTSCKCTIVRRIKPNIWNSPRIRECKIVPNRRMLLLARQLHGFLLHVKLRLMACYTIFWVQVNMFFDLCESNKNPKKNFNLEVMVLFQYICNIISLDTGNVTFKRWVHLRLEKEISMHICLVYDWKISWRIHKKSINNICFWREVSFFIFHFMPGLAACVLVLF